MNASDVLDAAERFADRNAPFKKDFDKAVDGLRAKLIKKMCGSALEDWRHLARDGGSTFIMHTVQALLDPDIYKLAKKFDKHKFAVDGTLANDLRHHLVELTLGNIEPTPKPPTARPPRQPRASERSSQPSKSRRKPQKVSSVQPLK